MQVSKTRIPEVLLFEPKVYPDERGFFFETWRKSTMEEQGIPLNFVQDNHSRSSQGTLRGLHYQHQQPQGKLIRAIVGEIYDVAVDMRRSSPTFGQWVAEVLSAQNKKQLWIPPGFAHGFYVVSDIAEIVYKCTDYYNHGDEYSLIWNDPKLAIPWPLVNGDPVLSEKDSDGTTFSKSVYFD